MSTSKGMRALAAALCLPALAGCPPAPIEMEIEEAGGQFHVLLFRQGWFGLRSGEPPCVHTIELSGPGSAAAVWRAASGDGRCADLQRFTVGRAPAGFAESVRFDRGRLSGPYRLEVRGIGEGAGEIRF